MSQCINTEPDCRWSRGRIGYCQIAGATDGTDETQGQDTKMGVKSITVPSALF